MVTNRLGFVFASLIFGIGGYTGSTEAATQSFALGNTGWMAEFDDTKVKNPNFAGTVFSVTTEFAFEPIDIKFIEKLPADADASGLRITLNETVKSLSQITGWKGFGLELIDLNPVLTTGDSNGNILGKNDNVMANHPGFAHFHKDPGQTFAPFTPTPNPQGAGAPQQGRMITLVDGTFYPGATNDWKGIGIHQIEEKNQQRNFILRETPSIPPIPEPETYAMLLAGLGLLGFMARHRKIS
jgi:PEP-CTERM motif